jgi:hypothetical protein
MQLKTQKLLLGTELNAFNSVCSKINDGKNTSKKAYNTLYKHPDLSCW